MTPDSGRLAVYDAPNKPFEIRRFPVRAPRTGEVLVKIRMSTICRSDIHSYLGHRPNPCPGVLGHEIIGTIVAQMPAKQPDGTMGVSRASLERAELNLDAASRLAPDNAEVKAELASVRTKLAELKK